MDSIPHKRCTRCGVEKPLEDFYHDRTARDGHYPSCKACHYTRKVWPDTKRCPQCGEDLPFNAFGPNKNRYDKLAAYCRACANAIQQSYNTRNKEHVRKLSHIRQQSTKIEHNAWKSEWRATHPEQTKAAQRRYIEKHPDARRRWTNTRRARKLAAQIKPVNYNAVLQRDGWVCHICGGFILDDLVFDHIIPLAKGGAHSEENLSPAHRHCNQKKWAHLVSSAAPPRIRKR